MLAGEPLSWLRSLCGENEPDPRLSVWESDVLQQTISQLAAVLGQGAKRNVERATQIELAMDEGPTLAAFDQLLAQFCDDKGEPRGHDHKRGKLLAAIERELGDGGMAMFEMLCGTLSGALWGLQRRSREGLVLALNEALFTVGTAYLERYQALKAERRVFDFSDLEWQAWRLLNTQEHAAYLQSRLDARYSHILLDEFLAAADRRFDALDRQHLGYLSLQTLPKTPVQRVLERIAARRAKQDKARKP